MPRRGRLAALVGVVFLSGAASLVYEVLWLKELGRLFGSTAYATATTLSIFFLGLAVGGALFGRWAPHLAFPLRTYAWLEAGVAGSALLYFFLLDIYYWLYQPLYTALADHLPLFNLVKLVLSTMVLFPPAVLMGGTLPVMAQHVIRQPAQLGHLGSLLYAANTLGAATGAFIAGFYLPLAFGFTGAYALAIGLNLAVAAMAWVLARRETPEEAPAKTGRQTTRRARPAPVAVGSANTRMLLVVAFASGTCALGLEVIWTRMFSQVLQNSVYTFSAILVVFLVSLAAGSLLANRLCRLRARPPLILWMLLVLSSLSVAVTPFMFYDLTAGLTSLSTGSGWGPYIASIFINVALLLFVPIVLLGSVFPYLLRMAQGMDASPGAIIGRLHAFNTAGGVVGSLLAGFVLLGTAGLWPSVRLFAIVYMGLAVAMLLLTNRLAADRQRAPRRPVVAMAITAATLVLLATALDPTGLPLVSVNAGRGELVLETWEGPDGVVAVVERESGRRIKVNNFYALGGTAALEHEQNQALIPLMAHPRPESVFFLGLGTGITAGTSLRLPTAQVTVCELVPEVITAAATYFNDPAGGLFTSPRARVMPCDGRAHLLGTSDRYDVIVADLFIPWRSGVGGLYSREHFAAARSRLTEGGIFVQWIPLYQVSRSEFELIARTMLDVFPQVTLWRGDFFATKPIVAVVGSLSPSVLDPDAVIRNGRHLAQDESLPDLAYLAVTLPFYAGNLTAGASLIPAGPLNADNRPLVEYLAPMTHRNERAGRVQWFTSTALVEFFQALAHRVPPERDPYLAQLGPEGRGFVSAGLSYHRASVATRLGQEDDADAHLREFARLLPVEFRPGLTDNEVYTEFGPQR